MLTACFRKRLPDFTLNVNFAVEEEVLVLAGPSGSGKTTILECLCGLQKPEEGRILLNDKILYSSDARINLPPSERGIGYIFQDYALFEHMTVKDNILYGVKRTRGTGRDERLPAVLERMGIVHLMDRYPIQLSGGERQRVALARALMTRPSILLLDEPLAALDRRLREKMRQELRELHRAWQIPFILVTHCRCEEQLADKILRPLQGPDNVSWAERKEDVLCKH